MMNKIARFEALAEWLVEGTFARLFAERLSLPEVTAQLAKVVEDHRFVAPDGVRYAPTHYWVYLHPHDYNALACEQGVLETELACRVSELAAQAGLILQTEPTVYLLADEGVGLHRVRMEARWVPAEVPASPVGEETHELAAEEAQLSSVAAVSRGRPFLILAGQRHINLLQPIVSIGRALDNDVIIEDSRVSRHHVQLRQRYGRYVLYDLGSSGGVQINGYPVEECVLHSGDVISLAGVQLIYGEDPPTPVPLPHREDTPPLGSEVREDVVERDS